MSVEQMAAALDLDPERYQAFEHGSLLGALDLSDAASLLQVALHELLQGAESGPREALRHLWGAVGPTGAQTVGLAAVTAWVNHDAMLSNLADPSDQAPSTSRAAKGVPAAGPSIFQVPTLPSITIAGARESWGPVRSRVLGSSVARQIASTWKVAGERVDPWQVARSHGVNVGLADLGDDRFSETYRLGGGVAVVVNSRLASRWRDRALTHALTHLSAGHLVLATVHFIPDLDDDSIYSCAGISPYLCWAVDSTVDALYGDGGHGRDDHGHAAHDGVVEEGQLGGTGAPQEAFDVGRAHGALRRELGLPHECLLERGDLRAAWPPALAHRWVAVAARGLLLHTGPALAQIPAGSDGYPTVGELEDALYRGQMTQGQREAANAAEVAALFSGEHWPAERASGR